MSIERRVKKAEEKLNVGKEPTVCEIVMYGGGPLPPEQRDGNRVTRFVSYDELVSRGQNEC